MVNRLNIFMKGGKMDSESDKLEMLTKVEKEALCYRLLIERDKINESLRKAQQSIKDMETDV
jgi:hypothetical protein